MYSLASQSAEEGASVIAYSAKTASAARPAARYGGGGTAGAATGGMSARRGGRPAGPGTRRASGWPCATPGTGIAVWRGPVRLAAQHGERHEHDVREDEERGRHHHATAPEIHEAGGEREHGWTPPTKQVQRTARADGAGARARRRGGAPGGRHGKGGHQS